MLEFRDPLPVLVAFSLEQVAPIQSRRAPDAQKFSSPPDLNTHAARTRTRAHGSRTPTRSHPLRTRPRVARATGPFADRDLGTVPVVYKDHLTEPVAGTGHRAAPRVPITGKRPLGCASVRACPLSSERRTRGRERRAMAGSSSVRAGFAQGRALYPGTFGAIRIRHLPRFSPRYSPAIEPGACSSPSRMSSR